MRIKSVRKFLPSAFSISRTRGLKMTQWEKGGRILISRPPLSPRGHFPKWRRTLKKKEKKKERRQGHLFFHPFSFFFFFGEGNDLESPRGGYQGHRWSLLASSLCLATSPFSAGTFFGAEFSSATKNNGGYSSRYRYLPGLVRPREAGERPVQIKIQHGSCALWTLICPAL